MAIYHSGDEPPRPETFPGPPPKVVPQQDSGRDTLGIAIFLAFLIVVIAGGGLAWYWLRPEITLATPVEETLPFQRTASYAAAYDEIVQQVGTEPTVTAGPLSALDWSVAGGAAARVHLQLAGNGNEVQVFADWERVREAWLIKTASYRIGQGEQAAIPLGNGNFLSRYDLAAWRAADPSTTLGQGQRELLEGRPIQAIRLFSDVLGTDQQSVEALLWRGRSFEAVGNVPKALSDYQRILVLDPDHSAALARLDGLRASPQPGQELAPRPTVPPPPGPTVRPSALIPD